MNYETANKCFDALIAGEGRYWDCRVLTKDGVFKANDIQLAEFPQIAKSLKQVQIANKFDSLHAWDLDLSKYSHKPVLEFLRFVYLSETANLTGQRNQNQQYLAEEVWALATEFEIAQLQEQCVKALSSDSITVEENNFLRLAQLGGEMNSKSLLRKCLTIFQQKLAINEEDALKEVREGAPMFLNAVIAKARYLPPASIALASPQNTGEGFVIDSHDWDDELFEEVLSSDHFNETKRHLTSDFEIRCSDAPDRPIRCHRNILARVPHFRQMIRHDCEETRRKFVELKKERKVVIETLRYVYTGKNTDLPHRVMNQETFLAESVIDLAQQYGLYVLKQRCHETMLECDISHSNVLRLLGVAVMYELNELKSKCLRYFFNNREVLLTTDQWWNADVAVVRAVVEYVLIERFCVYDHSGTGGNSVWTIDWNGCKSSEIAVGGRVDLCTPLVQLNHRTVMIFTADRQAKLFDLIDHSVTDCSPMQSEHQWGTACVFNGDVYVTGGGEDDDKCERYNRATNTWEGVADFNRSRRLHTLVVWKGSLLAIGGTGSDGSIEHYDAVADRWEVIWESEGRLDGYVRAAVINSELWVWVRINEDEKTVWKIDLEADEMVEIPAPHETVVQCMFERQCKAHLIGRKSLSDSIYLCAFDEDANGWKDVFEISKSKVVAIPIVPGEV